MYAKDSKEQKRGTEFDGWNKETGSRYQQHFIIVHFRKKKQYLQALFYNKQKNKKNKNKKKINKNKIKIKTEIRKVYKADPSEGFPPCQSGYNYSLALRILNDSKK